MKPTPTSPPKLSRGAIMACACLCTAFVGLPAQAGITVDPSKIVSGTAYGTLFAIDVPTTTVFPMTGGPDWTTSPPAGVTAVTADNGFVGLSGYGIREAYGNSPWEPDGTVFGTAKTYGTYSTGNPNVTYNFNLADAGVNLPDGAIIWGVYATWATRNNDGATYRYDEGSVVTTTRSHKTAPASDMVLSWEDSVAVVRNANFDRLFTGPIIVAGGDGFVLDVIDNQGNTAHIDTIVIDYSVPGPFWDIDGTTAGAGGATPSGTWDAATGNWDATADGTGAAATWIPGNTAVFSAGDDATGSYTVTVDGTQAIGGLFFQNGNPTLAAGTAPELQIDSDSLVTVLDGNTATIAAPFTETGGSWALEKLGAGSLVLSGDNSGVTGGTALSGGITQLDAPNSIPGTGENLTLNADAILRFGTPFVDTNIPAALDRIVTTSTGVIVADNYASTNFDLDTPGLASAFFGAVGNVNYTGTLTPNSAGYRLGGSGGTLTLPAALSSGLALTTKAPGTTQLNGFSSSVGSLSGDGDLENGSGSTAVTLTVDQSTNATFSGSINDGGAASTKLVKSGSSNLSLRGTSDFSGGVEIAGSGRLDLTNAGNEQSNLGAASNVVTFTADGELYNSNGTVTIPQGITINGGVTGAVSGAFGEKWEIDGVLAGTGTLEVRGYSAGYQAQFRNTANTFTGPIVLDSVDSLTARFSSLPDSPGVTTIGLDSQNNHGAKFEYGGAIAPLVLNNRQFELIRDGNSGTNAGRQAKIVSSSSGANTITIAQDLLITGTGTKKLYLGGGNTDNNAFNGAIPDGVAAAALTLYKENGGKWILGGANTYTGGTVMSGGTLTVDGSLADSSMTISSGNVNGSGTLTFGTADQVVLTGGDIDLSGLTVEGAGLTDPVYIIVDSTGGGSYTGTFAVENVPGYTVNYDYDGFGTQVALEAAGGGSPFETWAGGTGAGLGFDEDKNGDGVDNGLAFLLGAADPDVDANDKLPTATETAGGLILEFDMLDSASRGTATLSVEHSSDLGDSDPWTVVAVPDADGGPTDGVTFVVPAAGGSPSVHEVTATIGSGEAIGGKLFGRLSATE